MTARLVQEQEDPDVSGAETGGQPSGLTRMAEVRRRTLIAGAAVLGSWLLAVAAHALAVDWILYLLLLFGVASVLRSGVTILDRLFLSVGLLTGLFMAAGLVFSVWPWGLQPAVVGATSLTVLVVVCAVTGRRPELPRPFRPGEVGVVVAMLAALALVLRAYRTWSVGEQVALFPVTDDYARHFQVFDTIRLIGGYLFLQESAASDYLPGEGSLPGMTSYPQGAHFVYALLANAVESGAPGSGGSSFTMLTMLSAGTFVVLCGAVIWAVRWVAGPAMSTTTTLLASLGVGAFVVLNHPIGTYMAGSTSELVGLTLTVLMAAVSVRPLVHLGEHVLMLAALLVGISMTYYLYLPLAVCLVLLSLWQVRQRAWRHRWYVLAVAVVTTPLALLEPLLNSRSNTGEFLQLAGAILAPSEGLVGGLALFAGAGAVVLAVRSPVWRTATLAMVVTMSGLIALRLFVEAATSGYYYRKLLHAAVLVMLVYIGSAALVLQRSLRARVAGMPRWRRLATVGVSLTLLGAGTAVLVVDLAPDNTSWGAGWAMGRYQQRVRGNAVGYAYERFPNADGMVTIVWLDRSRSTWNPSLTTGYLSVLQRNDRYGWAARQWLYPPHNNRVEDLPQFLRTRPVPVRILTDDPAVIDVVSRLQAQEPGVRVTLIDARGWRD